MCVSVVYTHKSSECWIVVNSLSSYFKFVILVLILLQATNALAYEALTTGESFSASKIEACKKALDHARESAAQQARVFVSSKYEKRIKYLSGDIIVNVTHKTYQSTFGITELEETIKEKSKYDEETGSITCQIEAKFNVDTDAVAKELEARISSEEAKIKEANRKSKLLTTLKNNKYSYIVIKEKANKYVTSVYTASVICKENYSVRDCKKELVEKFKKEKSVEIAKDLNIHNKYVSVIFNDFEGDEEHKNLKEYDDAFAITMTGAFNYSVDVSDPYIEENHRIINELALVNGNKTGNSNHKTNSSSPLGDNTAYKGDNNLSESNSFFSNLLFDAVLIKGDLIGNNERIDEGKSEAYINSLVQVGVIFDVGDGYSKNLFRLAFYSGKVNLHTCLSAISSDKCDLLSTIDTKVKGIGLEKIFESRAMLINFGGVFYKVEDKDVIGADFFQIKLGISNKGSGPYIYADIYTLFPTSNTVSRDIEASFDLTFGVGVRF